MTRSLYAGRTGDTVVSTYAMAGRQFVTLPADLNGNSVRIALEVWDSPTGTRLTNLRDTDGTTAITVVLTDAGGQVPAFYGPDGYHDVVWLRDPDGDYFRIEPDAAAAAAEAADHAAAADAAKTSAEAARDGAAGSASSASTSAGTATTKAGEAEVAADTATTKAGEASTSAGNAATSATDAETARTEAETARTEAETARAGAEAVGSTNDTIIAGRINDTASQTRAALNLSFAARKGVTGAYDGLVAAMRPTKFLKTYTVDASIAASVPALRLYKTYAEAYNQSLADAKGYFNNATGDLLQLTPEMWHKIVVNPGVYLERVPVHNFLAVVNPTGNWDDVIFRDGGDTTTGGVLSTGGVTFWGYGFTVDYTGTDRQWHPHRDSGADGAFNNYGYQKRLVLLDNVKLWTSSASANAEACATDSTPGPGTTIVYNRVWFKGDAVPQIVNLVAGTVATTQGNSATPATIMVIEPTVDSNHTPTTGEAGQYIGVNHPVGLVSFNSTRKDKIIWVGGTWNVGDPTYASGDPLAPPGGGQWGVFSNISCVVDPATGTDFYIDPAVSKVATFLSTDSSKTDIPNNAHQHREVYVPALPDHGATRQARDYYGEGAPTLIDKTRLAHPTPSTARRTLTANRIYYVKVPVFSQILPGRISLGATVTAAGGKFAAAFTPDAAGVPGTDANYNQFFPVTTMFPGGDRVTATTTSRKSLVPGQGYVWLAFATDDATATFESVLSPTLGVEVRYKDGWAGGTLTNHTGTTPLPDGAAVPLPVLHAMQEVVAVFEANGTYTVPLGARALRIEAYGGGGGGGGGRRGAAASVRAGGAGGAGGAHSILTIPTWRLPATLSVTTGAAGVAGAAATADDTNGGAGGGGGLSYVTANGKFILKAAGGPGGAGGAQAAAAGGAAQTGTDGVAGAGASSSASGGGGASAPTNPYAGTPGGGAGGGITTGNAASTGGGGGFVFNQSDESNVTGGAIDTPGSMGHSTASGYGPGNSGSGGGSSLAGPGGTGGDGGYWGAGAGGGGASTNGQNSGAGGKGAPGIVTITAIF